MDARVKLGESSEGVVATDRKDFSDGTETQPESSGDRDAQQQSFQHDNPSSRTGLEGANIPADSSKGTRQLEIHNPSSTETSESPPTTDLTDGQSPDKLIPLRNSSNHSRRIQWPHWKLRPADDDEEQNWWFASTAIPLIAATTGPLANVLSIAALVTKWRNHVPIDGGPEIPDPHWCIALNGCSLACGFTGNLFLLFNFTRKIRYIVALPMSIIFWYFATGILIAIEACMNKYIPPAGPDQVYSQGFWHAVLAAIFYMISSMILMINMLGYFLGHYPQHFTLTDHQRTLILQTMMFFIWLAGGAGVFAQVCDWSFVDALYFCDVTILTVGFGDYIPVDDAARGLVLPYSVGGIIILGLMVNSIRNFSLELSREKIIKRHVERKRARTIEKVVTTSTEIQQRMATLERRPSFISSPMSPREIFVKIPAPQAGQKPLHVAAQRFTDRLNQHEAEKEKEEEEKEEAAKKETEAEMEKARQARTHHPHNNHSPHIPGQNSIPLLRPKAKLILLRAEKDRFLAMRNIQRSMARFKRWYALSLSVTAFALLWCLGAVVFWRAEREVQGMTYFKALYFCYVSLLTIGYGDLAPKSNVGKPFFIVWSLIAVPTMTILVSDMGDTVIHGFNRATFVLGDWTILPKAGLWNSFLEKNKWAVGWWGKFVEWREQKQLRREQEKRIAEGFPIGPAPGEGSDDYVAADDPEAGSASPDVLMSSRGTSRNNARSRSNATTREQSRPTLETLATEELDERALARRLTAAIRRVADDLKLGSTRKYEYEEWVEFTRLIRFSALVGRKGNRRASRSGGRSGVGGGSGGGRNNNGQGAEGDDNDDDNEMEDDIEQEEQSLGLVDWDWIGEDSPMLADQTEPEWVLDRLCESLDRYFRRTIPPPSSSSRRSRSKRKRTRQGRTQLRFHDEHDNDDDGDGVGS
ncbi:voltage-gated potassium channel [Xylona heveae TC161]|uniref:Voltage-gated potassium channel n=1 Tax=Xylona heveae (strain CBS 132557 / TC161) TaxID=1328760 RepID=A0A165HGU2_XYLHT|nr:voltage-gated potassium channel [Xylona heveae TC161]KZF23493.1 voltage-gated potassium channel [Xylona heveae TC161]